MLFAIRRVFLKQRCPHCSGKIFRNLLTGTMPMDKAGDISYTFQVCDFCENCHHATAWTHFSQDAIEGALYGLFDAAERGMRIEDFTRQVGELFRGNNGGWFVRPSPIVETPPAENDDDQGDNTAAKA